MNEKVETYEKDILDLFKAWKNKENHKNKTFIEDGVINPERYFSGEERVLFLLKEAYGNGKSFSLVEDYLKKQDIKISNIWKRVSLWVKVLQHYIQKHEILTFTKNNEITHNGNVYLEKIAVVNVKKSDGKSTSDDENLRQYVVRDKFELFSQLQICDPTIIVCGNTGNYLKSIVGEYGCELVQKNTIEREHFIYNFELNGHNVVVINFWHPSNQFPDILNYYGFANIAKLALDGRMK